MFSRRVPDNLAGNRIAQAVERVRSTGRDIIDLTESNPTRVGLRYPPDLLAPLADARGLTYTPHPFGLTDARDDGPHARIARRQSKQPDRIVRSSRRPGRPRRALRQSENGERRTARRGDCQRRGICRLRARTRRLARGRSPCRTTRCPELRARRVVEIGRLAASEAWLDGDRRS